MKILAWISAKIKRQRPKKSRKFQFSAASGTLNSRTSERAFYRANFLPPTRSILVDYGSADTVLVLEVPEK